MFGYRHKSNRTCGQASLLILICTFLLVGCSKLSFRPAPVVPTKTPLPYSAQIRLTELGVYAVEPGATMRTDPTLQNHVTHADSTLAMSQKEWEHAIIDYVTARQTFIKVVEDGAADVALALRLFIYIDPGVGFKFNHTYVARADTLVKEPRSGRVLASYSGFGKAFGVVSRGAREDDEAPINKSTQTSLNDLFDKLEKDRKTFP